MTVATCGDCGAIYTRQDGHRCKSTVFYSDLLGSFVDGAVRIADLERQVVELKAENARLKEDR